MIQTPEVDRMVTALAEALNEQFRYIPCAPRESQPMYEAAIKDSCVATASVLHKFIAGFNVDHFYSRCGYPGTRPIHG